MVCREKLIVNLEPEEKEIIVEASQLQKRSINSVARVGAVKYANEILKKERGQDAGN